MKSSESNITKQLNKHNKTWFKVTRGRCVNKPSLYHYLDYIEMFYEEQNKKKTDTLKGV